LALATPTRNPKVFQRLLAIGALALGSFAAQQDRPIPADTEIVTTASGLKYSVLAKGDDVTKPKSGDRVKVHYTGWLPDSGKIFDSSLTRGEPFEFPLGQRQVIAGWDEGVALMTRGARYKFTIPPGLAYGEQGSGRIPANATLVFEVELLDVVRAPEFRPANKEAQKTTPDGLTYEVLVEGVGALANDTDILTMKLAIWRANGELLHSTEIQENNNPRKGTADSFGWPIIKRATKVLKIGSRYRFEAKAVDSLGAEMGAQFGPDALLVWELELMDAKPSNLPKFAMPAEGALKTTPSGLKYEVIKEGTGRKPTATETVTVHYAGWLTDGTPFDSSYSRGDTTSFPLNRVIKGWTEGVQLMGEGSIYKFVIPGDLAYGQRGSPPKIGPNATLVFQIELVKIGK
jgi:FKBP-type peptidyl-prolyl cis-trans isomerase